jgi:hypothetical protein
MNYELLSLIRIQTRDWSSTEYTEFKALISSPTVDHNQVLAIQCHAGINSLAAYTHPSAYYGMLH